MEKGVIFVMNKNIKFIIGTIVTFVLIFFWANINANASSNLTVDSINANVIGTEADVEWSNVNGATGYQVYVDLPNIGYQHIGDIGANKVKIIGFQKGKIYGIKIKAYKVENKEISYSEFSPEIRFKIGENTNVTSNLSNIQNINAVSYGQTGEITWDEVENANGYEIYASLENGEFINLCSVISSKVKVINMNKDYIYNIKIKPFMEISGQKIYGTLSDTAILKYDENKDVNISKVTNLTVNVTEGKAELKWDKVENADGYEICVDIAGKQEAVYGVNYNNATLENLTEGFTYNAKVRAYKYVDGKKIYGNYSNSVSMKYEEEKIEKPDKVTGVTVDLPDDTGTFNWNKVEGADGYELCIYRPGVGNTLYTTTETTYTMRGFTDYEYNYNIRIRAYKIVDGKKEYGEYSDTVYFKCPIIPEETKPDKVTGVTVYLPDDTGTFNWNKVEGADGYELCIYRPGVGNTLYTTTETTYTMRGFTDYEYNYNIRIRAYKIVNGKKEYGEYSDAVYFKCPIIPEETKVGKVTGVTVYLPDDTGTFNWNKVEGADGYELWIYRPGVGNTLYTTTGTTYTMRGFTDYEYHYNLRIRAYKVVNGEKVYGEYSDAVYFKCPIIS